MSKSFFTARKDAALYTGSNSFAAQILATPTAFGLTSAQATAYGALNDTFGAAYLAANDPLTRTKGKVAAKNTARANLRIMASDLAKIIEGTASVTDEQKEDLGLSVRGTPGPVGPPGTPEGGTVSLNGMGGLKLKWKCKNPSGAQGTMYQIWRNVDAGPLEYVGGCGQKSYTDATVPAGAAVVAYHIQAVRSTAFSDFATFTVTFGTGGATVTEEKSEKIAA